MLIHGVHAQIKRHSTVSTPTPLPGKSLHAPATWSMAAPPRLPTTTQAPRWLSPTPTIKLAVTHHLPTQPHGCYRPSHTEPLATSPPCASPRPVGRSAAATPRRPPLNSPGACINTPLRPWPSAPPSHLIPDRSISLEHSSSRSSIAGGRVTAARVWAAGHGEGSS